VSYVSGDPKTAQKVTERLASLFIEENLRDREVQAEGTNQFLDSQLEEARRRLLEQENKVEEYKRRYGGELPSQTQANLQVIANAQSQLQTLGESMNRDRDRRLVLERQLAELMMPEPVVAPIQVQAPLPTEPPPGTPTFQLVELAQSRLQGLKTRYTAEHPDVQAAQRALRELEARLAEEMRAKPAPVAPDPPRPPTAADLARERRRQDLRAELASIETQLARKQVQEADLQATIAAYQVKVDGVPTREAELTELTRDYSTIQSLYTNLLSKREESKLAANLERNQIGEQFKVLDPARVPERPFSPDLLRLNALGAGLGLMIGVGLAAFVEYRDASFHTAADVQRVLNLPVLALVPMMISDLERRARRRYKVAALIGMFVVVASSALVLHWVFQMGGVR
jgi:polysaccharide chain length determinant protein (PEP-CTERM system associated)